MKIEINLVNRGKGKGIAKEWLSMSFNKNVIEFRYENFVPESVYDSTREILVSYYNSPEEAKTTLGKVIKSLETYLPTIAEQGIKFLEEFDPSKNNIKIKVKTRRDDDYLEIKVELRDINDEIFSESEDSTRVFF